jgi:iron complex transport system ATP-binding protein
MILQVDKLSCGYGSKTVLEDISFSVANRECMCLLGPNGVGKTTLFKTILGLLKPMSGDILLDGANRNSFSIRELAKQVAFVPQAHIPPFPFTAQEVVSLGRTAHLGLFSSPSSEDMKIAIKAMEMLNILHLKDTVYTQISGGERQMVMIARALAQQPKLLILDEPTANLDFGNQARVLARINQLREENMSIVMTTHNPDHTFVCATNVLLILPDGSVKVGSCREVVTVPNMRKAYGIETCVGELQWEGGIQIETCVPVISGLM